MLFVVLTPKEPTSGHFFGVSMQNNQAATCLSQELDKFLLKQGSQHTLSSLPTKTMPAQ
jgi:hypothetical protein